MKYIKKTIIEIGFILCVLIFILNIIYISNISNGWEEKVTIEYIDILNFIMSIVLTIGIFFFSYYIDRYLTKKNSENINQRKMIIKKCFFIGTIFLIYIVVQIVWINVRKAYPIADSMRVYDAACQMYHKEPIAESKYFELYPQNLSLAYLFSKIFSVVNSCDQTVIEIVNIIANCLTIVGLYLILNLIKEKYQINRSLFTILSFTYLPIILLVNFIYGDLVSLPFTIFAVFSAMKYVNNDKKIYLLLSSILTMISVCLRMNNLIFAIAITIYLIINAIETKSILKVNILRLLMIILYVIVSIVPSNILKNILINRYALNPDNSFPISGFVAIGMQEGMRGNGWYNNNADIAWKEIETADIQYKQMIKENIYNFKNNIPHAVKFYIKKIASMWTDPMQESIWQNLSFNFYEIYLKDKSPEEINYYQKVDNMLINNQKWAKIYQKALLFIIFGLSILVIIKNRANISNEIILLLLCFMGGLFFHILWEAKSRYIIPYIIILIPIACIKFNTKLKENENSEKDISSYTNVL